MKLPAWAPIKHNLERDSLVLLFITLLVSGAVWVYYCFQKYAALGYERLDLAIYTQVFYNTSYGRWFAMSIHPQSYLGDHFEPLIAPLSLIFALWRDPRLLLLLQIVVVHLAAIPLYFLARSVFKKSPNITSPQLLALLIAISYLLNPLTQNALNFEFHILPFFLLPFFIALWAASEGKLKIFIVACLFSALTREDVALLVIPVGLIITRLFPQSTKQHRKIWQIIPILIGGIIFFTAIIVVSHFSPTGEYKYLGFYGTLHGSFLDTIWGLLDRGVTLVKLLILRPYVFQTGLALLITGGLLPILAPQAFWLALVPALEFGLTPSNPMQILNLHYGVLFLPTILLSLIFVMRNVSESKPHIVIRLLKVPNQSPMILVYLATVIMIGGAITGLFFIGPYQRNSTTTNKNQQRNNLARLEAIAMVGAKTSLVATSQTISQLATREHLYSLNYVLLGRQQLSLSKYIVPPGLEALIIDQEAIINTSSGWLNATTKKTPYIEKIENLRALITEQQLRSVWAEDGVAYFSSNPNQPTIPLIDHAAGHLLAPKTITDNIKAEPSLQNKSEGQILTINWSVNQQPTQIFFMNIEALDQEDNVITNWWGDPGWGIWPTLYWKPNEIITTTFPLTMPTKTARIRLSLFTSPYTDQSLSSTQVHGQPLTIYRPVPKP